MSIIQGVIGSVAGGSLSPNFYMQITGSYGEGYTTSLVVYWEHARNQTIYWTISSDSATEGVDYTSNSGYSGSLTVNGTGSQTVASITNIADNLTEGIEYYTIKLGTTAGAMDLYSTSININDLSVAPTTDFTIEWWQKMNSSQPGPYPRFFDVGSWSSENPGISFESGAIYVWGGGTHDSVSSSYLSDTYNTWTHWCIERYNNTIALYKNGTNILSTNNLGTAQINDSSNPLTIGYGSGGYWSGKMADFHWVKGSAKYQGTFSVPTAPIGTRTGSKLLLSVANDSDKFLDATGYHTLSTTNTVSFDTDTPYAGSSNGSLVFSNSYISIAASSDWAIDG